MTGNDDMDLDRLFAEAAATERPGPDAGFMARLMADAERLQPATPVLQPARFAARAPAFRALVWPAGSRPGGMSGGWIGTLADVFGGRAALAGMMAATVAGLYLGIAQPSVLSGLTTALYGQSRPMSVDLMSGGDSLWTANLQ